jgi:hypothetical protein
MKNASVQGFSASVTLSKRDSNMSKISSTCEEMCSLVTVFDLPIVGNQRCSHPTKPRGYHDPFAHM